MTTAEKVLQLKQDFDEVYEAGKSQGGGDEFYDTFWNQYQSNGSRKHHNYAFAGDGWDDVTYNPKYDFGQITYANYMFSGNRITDTLKPVDISTASATIYSMFGTSTLLKTIRTITIAEKNVLSGAFNNLTALEDISFEGVIGCSLDFHWSTKLTADSLESIVTHLSTRVTGQTITLPTTAESTYNAKYGEGAWETLTTPITNWTFAYLEV